MEDRGIFKGCGFWVLALLWLPAGVVAQALVRFMPETGTQADAGLSAAMLPMLAGSLVLPIFNSGSPFRGVRWFASH